ncbi:hypothetical protein D9M70_541820 [compost metagenome]
MGEVEAPELLGKIVAIHRQRADGCERHMLVASQRFGDGHVAASLDYHLVKTFVDVVVLREVFLTDIPLLEQPIPLLQACQQDLAHVTGNTPFSGLTSR